MGNVDCCDRQPDRSNHEPRIHSLTQPDGSEPDVRSGATARFCVTSSLDNSGVLVGALVTMFRGGSGGFPFHAVEGNVAFVWPINCPAFVPSNGLPNS
jgi:hypothetical protein